MHTPRITLTFFSRYWEGYRRELQHFVETVADGRTDVAITGRMVLADFKVCTALQRSAETGKPVEIQWEKDEVPQQYFM